jgi:hypothetical protein
VIILTNMRTKKMMKAFFRNRGAYDGDMDCADMPALECSICGGLSSPGGYKHIDDAWDVLKDLVYCMCPVDKPHTNN